MNKHLDIIMPAFLEAYSSAQASGTQFDVTCKELWAILEHYTEHFREFHTLAHIADGCEKMLAMREQVRDFPTLFLAWVLHDTFCAPECPQNEQFSAELAEHYLASLVSGEMLTRIKQMICATKGHLVPDDFSANYKEDLAILISIDLSGFADDREKFIADGELIRQEWRLTETEWIESRGGFAQMLSERERILPAECFQPLEASARANVNWSIEEAERVKAA